MTTLFTPTQKRRWVWRTIGLWAILLLVTAAVASTLGPVGGSVVVLAFTAGVAWAATRCDPAEHLPNFQRVRRAAWTIAIGVGLAALAAPAHVAAGAVTGLCLAVLLGFGHLHRRWYPSGTVLVHLADWFNRTPRGRRVLLLGAGVAGAAVFGDVGVPGPLAVAAGLFVALGRSFISSPRGAATRYLAPKETAK